VNNVTLKNCWWWKLTSKKFSKQKFTSETITKGIQWKEFGVGGIAQLHLEELHTIIRHEIVYLIPYFILYKI